jgi:uncharacterized membrane protein YfcA
MAVVIVGFGGLFLVFAICAVAVTGGVGGGALYMPLYVYWFGTAQLAVPIAKVSTNGVAWSAFVFNMFQRHPKRNQPLIDYDCSMLLEPLTLTGTIGGVLLNVVLKSWQVIMLLVVILGITGWTTLMKGIQQYKEEVAKLSGNKEAEMELEEESELEEQKAPFVSSNGPGLDDVAEDEEYYDDEDVDPEKAEAIAAWDEYDGRQWPLEKLFAIIGCWCANAFVLANVGPPGAKGPLALVCGTYQDIAMIGAATLVQIGVTLLWRVVMLNRQVVKDSIGIEFEIRYDRWTTIIYPIGSCFAGVCAGSLGIAGGLIKGPLMVQWGLTPSVATGTAIFMVMFTSSSTIFQFWLTDRVDLPGYKADGEFHWGAAYAYWITGFLGGLVGAKVLVDLMKKSGRQSYVTILLAAIVLGSMVTMTGVQVYNIATGHEAEGDGFTCPAVPM